MFVEVMEEIGRNWLWKLVNKDIFVFQPHRGSFAVGQDYKFNFKNSLKQLSFRSRKTDFDRGSNPKYDNHSAHLTCVGPLGPKTPPTKG